MEKQLLFYERVVPISKQRHAKMSIKNVGNFNFAAQTNSVPLTTVEFFAAPAEYPVVFAETDGVTMPVAILGVKQNTNDYLTAEGKWDASYVPAFVRRYPFVFAQSDDGKTFTLCIDESFEGCDAEGSEGRRLFADDGSRTEFLSNMLDFVEKYQQEHNRTRLFCQRLSELGLLQQMQAQITLPSGEARSLTGFSVINRDRLKALDAETVNELFGNDGLELIYLHLYSLRNFPQLIKRAGAEAEGSVGDVPVDTGESGKKSEKAGKAKNGAKPAETV